MSQVGYTEVLCHRWEACWCFRSHEGHTAVWCHCGGDGDDAPLVIIDKNGHSGSLVFCNTLMWRSGLIWLVLAWLGLHRFLCSRKRQQCDYCLKFSVLHVSQWSKKTDICWDFFCLHPRVFLGSHFLFSLSLGYMGQKGKPFCGRRGLSPPVFFAPVLWMQRSVTPSSLLPG